MNTEEQISLMEDVFGELESNPAKAEDIVCKHILKLAVQDHIEETQREMRFSLYLNNIHAFPEEMEALEKLKERFG